MGVELMGVRRHPEITVPRTNDLEYKRQWRDARRAKGEEVNYMQRLTPENKWRSHLKARYGISGEQWDAMFAAQEGKCAICRSELALCVDHDHESGMVRALLCRRCNSGIGQFGDDLDLLKAAVAYLENARSE